MLSGMFIAAMWSPAGKGLTCWLLLVLFMYFCYSPIWYPGSGVVLDCRVSQSLPSFLLSNHIQKVICAKRAFFANLGGKSSYYT